MRISVVTGPAETIEVDALIVAYPKAAKDPSPWDKLDQSTDGLITEALQSPAFRGAAGTCLAVPIRKRTPCRDLILVGLGDPGAGVEGWRRAVADGADLARRRGHRRVGLAVPEDGVIAAPARLAAAAAEAIVLGNYRYTEFKRPEEHQKPLESALLVTSTLDAPGQVKSASIIAGAVCWARDLINTPPSDKRPPELAAIAATMAAETGLSCHIIDEREAASLGLNALLAVARGSSAGPRMVILEHAPAGATGAPVVLVGKGVTFDTGGISIKPAKGMDEMKADMSGAAAVLAAMRAAAELDLPLRVGAVVPMAENMPGGDSYRPGDLVRAYNGTTIEVLNTDAEGRMILADALAYAREHFAPACMIDLATLTGACVVALGEEVAGLMGNDEELAAELVQASDESGERLWRLPMYPEYRKLIESRVADIKNTGGRWGGAITAAKFLQEFVGDTPWAHLDIAGPAYATKDAPYRPRGGVGFGVRLLLSWLQARAGGHTSGAAQ